MKKRILKIALFVVFTMTAGYTTYSHYKSHILSGIALANVEALASGEDGNKEYEYKDGYPYSSICGVQISKHKKCKVEVITCQGGGNGCNSKKCPTHGG